MIPPEVLINGAANTILNEQEPAVRDGLFKLFATNHSPQTSAGTLRELLCCLPKVWIPSPDSIPAGVETAPSPVPPKRSEAEPFTSGSSTPSQATPPTPIPPAD